MRLSPAEMALGLPRSHLSAEESTAAWKPLQREMVQIGLRVRAHNMGRIFLGRIGGLGVRVVLYEIRCDNGQKLSVSSLRDIEYDPDAAIVTTNGSGRRKRGRLTAARLPENVYRNPTDKVRAFCSERCGWAWDRRALGSNDSEAFTSSTVVSRATRRRLARRAGVGAAEGFMYFLDEDNEQVTAGPWALATLSMRVAWRRQLEDATTLAGVALQTQLFGMGINEAAMREPMRRQSAHDRKHSSEQKSATLVATLAAESDEQVRAVVDCIVDQIEASAGAERDRALAAAAGGDDMELENLMVRIVNSTQLFAYEYLVGRLCC